MVFGDNKNPNNHSIENSKSMNKQEGTLVSPPVNVFRISINGCEDNYVTLSDHSRIVADKDAEIARLNKELTERNNNMYPKEFIQGIIEKFINQQPSQNEQTDNSEKPSCHDVHFDNSINVPALTKGLISLSEKTIGIYKKDWIINSLKSWGIVCKILKDKGIFIGNNSDFCLYLLEEVFPKINDVNRRIKLMKLKSSNINHLPADIRDKKISEWNNEYINNPKQKKYEECIFILKEMNGLISKIKKIGSQGLTT